MPPQAGQNAELRFRQPDVDRPVFGGDAVGAGEGQLVPAAEAVAVDSGDGRGMGRSRDPLEDSFWPSARNFGQLLAVHLANLEQVSAGDEVPLFGGGENDSRRGLLS